MIDPHWSVVDLDPRTWRNVGRFFDPGQYIRVAQPGEHGLFILHDDGKILRVVDTHSGVRRDFDLPSVEDPHALAQSLYARGEWQRVHVINKRHLAQVARQAQAAPRRELMLDEYYHLIYQLLWSNPEGYVSLPPHPGHWHGWTYSALKHFVDQLPEEATLALGVFDGETVALGLILEFRAARLQLVTTFEALNLPPGAAQLSEAFLNQLWQQLAQQFASPAGALLCSQTIFEQWLVAENKAARLNLAGQQGAAFWRLSLRETVLPAFQSLVTPPLAR